MGSFVDPIFNPPPLPPPPPRPVVTPAAPAATPPAAAIAGGIAADRFASTDDPYADNGELPAFNPATWQPPGSATAPGGGAGLVAIADDRAFIEQAFLQMFGHQPVTAADRANAAGLEPSSEQAKNVAWRESLVADNLALLQGLVAQGKSPAEARQVILKGLMETEEFKTHMGLEANNLKLGLPITLIGPQGEKIPLVWHSQATFIEHGDRALYYGNEALPLDRPLSFEEGNRFLENCFCNGTSANAIAVTETCKTPADFALAAIGGQIADKYWGRDTPQGWVDYLSGKQAEIETLVAAHPELAPRAAEVRAMLGAGVPFLRATMNGGQAPLLGSVPGATTGWYYTNPPAMAPQGPVPVSLADVPSTDQRPRYAQIMDFYAKRTYEAGKDDPTSPVGRMLNHWLT